MVINLASDELYKSVKPKKPLDAEIIKPVFLDEKSGKVKGNQLPTQKGAGPHGAAISFRTA